MIAHTGSDMNRINELLYRLIGAYEKRETRRFRSKKRNRKQNNEGHARTTKNILRKAAPRI